MAYGKGSVSCSEVNSHKELAGACAKGNHGVGRFPPQGGQAQPARANTLPTSAKGPGIGSKGVMSAATGDRYSLGGKA